MVLKLLHNLKLFDANIDLNISLKKDENNNDSFKIITECINTQQVSSQFSITKTTATLADLAGGYQTVLNAYNEAKAALLAIIPGDNKNRWGRDKINEEIAKLQNYPFYKTQPNQPSHFQLGDGNNLDGSADTETYILFKEEMRLVKVEVALGITMDSAYDAVPYKIVFNGNELKKNWENPEIQKSLLELIF